MFDPKLVETLKERYKIHPLIFHRSMEHAETAGQLFDILESLPKLPMIWDEANKCWKTTEDPIQYDRLKLAKE